MNPWIRHCSIARILEAFATLTFRSKKKISYRIGRYPPIVKAQVIVASTTPGNHESKDECWHFFHPSQCFSSHPLNILANKLPELSIPSSERQQKMGTLYLNDHSFLAILSQFDIEPAPCSQLLNLMHEHRERHKQQSPQSQVHQAIPTPWMSGVK